MPTLIWKTGASWIKDPNEIIDEGFDWTDVLPDAQSISTSTWIVTGTDSDLTATIPAIDGAETAARFTGGTLGEDYTVTNRVLFSNGESFDRSWTVRVRAQ